MANPNAEKSISGAERNNRKQNVHRFLQITVVSIAIIISAAFLVYGWNYYFIDSIERPYSPKHSILKSGGSVGLRLGIAGMFFFIIVFLYPLRKHWAFLGRIGRTKNWFDYHVIFGLVTPAIVTFHSAFKLYGFAGMAYWTMLALLVSGLIGRYFYAQIPRNIDAAELSLKDIQSMKASMLDELRGQKIVEYSEVERLFSFKHNDSIQSMNIVKALTRLISLDLLRLLRTWSLRRRFSRAARNLFRGFGILKTGNRDFERVIGLASKQAVLSKQILFMSQAQRIFHLWHVIHRPFSLSFALFILIHITVVVWLGYY